MSKRSLRALVFVAGLAACGIAQAQSPRVLYTWSGTGNIQGWFKNFGTNTVTIANTFAGELTVTETGPAGSSVAISDDFNIIYEGAPGIAGGLDLTGLASLEIDLGHNGLGPISVQFFVQASTGANYVALGPDLSVVPGIATYSLPLSGLSADQIAYVRTIGLNIRDHAGEGNVVWTLQEVRSVGTPPASRNLITHAAGSSDNGLQGAIVNFDNAAVSGNDGGQNQTGLSHNTSPLPAGNDGTLRWVDRAGKGGAAISYGNGTAFNGNTFNDRPADFSSYRAIKIRMAATNLAGAVNLVDVQYFIQSGGFVYHAAGPNQTLSANGALQELCFPIEGIPNLDFVDQHGVNLSDHPGGDLVIDIDNIELLSAKCRAPGQVPALSIPGAVFLLFLVLAAGGLLLRRRQPFSS
jgi:hypothetical protein